LYAYKITSTLNISEPFENKIKDFLKKNTRKNDIVIIKLIK